MALQEAVERAARAGVDRVLINGSFVTARREPRDVDLVFRVGEDFAHRLAKGHEDALWIEERAREPRPKLLDLYLAVDEQEWVSWVRLFACDVWHGKKGLLEIVP